MAYKQWLAWWRWHVVRDFCAYAWGIACVNFSRLVTRIVSDFHLSASVHGVIGQYSRRLCLVRDNSRCQRSCIRPLLWDILHLNLYRWHCDNHIHRIEAPMAMAFGVCSERHTHSQCEVNEIAKIPNWYEHYSNPAPSVASSITEYKLHTQCGSSGMLVVTNLEVATSK